MVDTTPRSSLVADACDRLRDMIVDGELVPGQRLAENDLIAHLSVSRGTLREAMRALAAEGLIDLTPHQSARVRRFDVDELRDLFDIRVELETLAARLAATRHPEYGERLLDLAAQMEAAEAAGALRRHIDINREFHNTIIEASSNRQLGELLRLLHLQAFRAVFTKALRLEDAVQSNREHRAIATAVAAGDGDRAALEMRNHITRSRQLIERV